MKHQDKLKSRRQLLRELAAARLQLDQLEAEAHPHGGMEAVLREWAEMRAIIDVLPDLVIRVHREGTFLDVKSTSHRGRVWAWRRFSAWSNNMAARSASRARSVKARPSNFCFRFALAPPRL